MPLKRSSGPRAPRHVLYLEQLDPDAGKHELQKGGDDHDVADRPDGHKNALNDVLRGESREGMKGRLIPAKIVYVSVHLHMIC